MGRQLSKLTFGLQPYFDSFKRNIKKGIGCDIIVNSSLIGLAIYSMNCVKGASNGRNGPHKSLILGSRLKTDKYFTLINARKQLNN